MSGRLPLALVTVVTVLALVAGAPALETTPDGTDSSGVSTDQQRPEVGTQTQQSTDSGHVIFATIAVLTLIALGYALRQYGRDDAVVATLTTVGLTIAAAVVGVRRSGVVESISIGGANGSAVDSVTSTPLSSESLWALGAVGSFVVVAVAGVVYLRGTGTETWPTTDDDSDDDAGDAAVSRAELGVAAGRAADHLAVDAPSENAVYRAWREMTEVLDVPNPESSTPGEFAAVAEQAGMEPDDVATLTDLFEAVRYGDSEPTDERERRAEQALRNIERTHGSES
ncbi:DUF4129 domain-containing protein [Haloarcula sp. 1CSR25-25]|uniref:DUF4129 domain-containing protein n=1 Tax=Haloarcula sp. 1CSR25-25 TaxID=2862545 RepID=UPI0028948511|nr:DUF4129 domain-containing protein [Haloarcula sp. 1CSR25-25]MDT3437176.1 DUF4129 domain-containing protein [Haloarcula sp. 1CSR25-25]